LLAESVFTPAQFTDSQIFVLDSNRIPAAVCWRRDSLGLFHHVGSLGKPADLYHKDNHSADPKAPLIPAEDILPQSVSSHSAALASQEFVCDIILF
jgi:hypothetical protein